MRSLFISPHFSQLSLKLKYLITNYTNGNTDSTKTIRANLEQIFIEIGTAARTRSRCCFSLYHLFFCLIQYYPQSIHTSFSKIQKVSKFAQFSFKTTHISGCKNVHIYTFATLTMQLCMVTVALYNNNLFFFFFFSLSPFKFPLFPNGHNNSAKKKKTNIQPPTQHNPTITTATHFNGL